MSTKRPRSPDPSSLPQLFHSSTITHQTSSFTAVFSPTLPCTTLQALPAFNTATHKIAAWRIPSRQKSLTPSSKTLYDTGHDDDGESWAGKRLGNVLHDTQAVGSVVVARWYGGQNIGPVRFTHIENCAKAAIWKWKVAEGMPRGGESTATTTTDSLKKQKVGDGGDGGDDEGEKQEMINALRERDANIAVLRRLLAEKKARLDGEVVAPPTPQKGQAYEKMGLVALKRVDKARDATVAFILKQINKVDEELKLVEALEGDAEEVLEEKREPTEEELWKEAEEARKAIGGEGPESPT
ncbi:hypothetical protein ACN47E_001142 [Coniothyrium glycines]